MKKNELVIEFLSTLNCFKQIEDPSGYYLLHISSGTVLKNSGQEDTIYLRNDTHWGWMPVKFDTVVDIYIAEHLELEQKKEGVQFKRLKNEFDIKMGKYKEIL